MLEEIKGFIKAEAAVAVLHADSNPIILSHRLECLAAQTALSFYCQTNKNLWVPLFWIKYLDVSFSLVVVGPCFPFCFMISLFDILSIRFLMFMLNSPNMLENTKTIFLIWTQSLSPWSVMNIFYIFNLTIWPRNFQHILKKPFLKHLIFLIFGHCVKVTWMKKITLYKNIQNIIIFLPDQKL